MINSVRAVGITSAVTVFVIAFGVLSANDWDPSVFVGFGEQSERN